MLIDAHSIDVLSMARAAGVKRGAGAFVALALIGSTLLGVLCVGVGSQCVPAQAPADLRAGQPPCAHGNEYTQDA